MRGNKTADDFLLGGRRISPIALGLSLFATLVSTLSYLGTPGEMVAHGPMMITQIAAHPLVFVIVGYGLIPLLMRQPVTSAYEILESRLGPSIRKAGAGVFLLLRFGWMATILFATSYVVLVPLLGIDPWWTPWLCVALGVLTAMYASWGGFKAVVTADAIQSITMLLGAIATLVVITVRLGGVGGWWPDGVARAIGKHSVGASTRTCGCPSAFWSISTTAVVRLHEWLGPDVDPAFPFHA